MALLIFVVFAVLLLLRVPIAVSLGLTTLVCLIILGVPLSVIPQRLVTALDSFSIMAIPLFVLAGNIMSAGSMSRRLVDFASSIVGSVRGSLAYVSILACGFFAAMSGSGPATVSSIGAMLYPEMTSRGYPKERTAGLIAVAGGLGPVIPPSIIIVVFGTLTNTSIGDMFLAGAVIGLVMIAILIAIAFVVAMKEKWPKSDEKFSLKNVFRQLGKSIFALFMPVIVLGGIYGGLFTPTEAACVAVVYSLIVSCVIYRDVKLKDLGKLLWQSAIGGSVVMFIMATSSLFSWMFAYAGVAGQMVTGISALNLSYWGLLILITVILLIFGFFLEGVATVMLLMPVLFPLAVAMGINPVHMGLIVTVTNVIGQMTPPVAVNLFCAASISKLPIERISKGEMPFLIGLIAVLVLIVVFPQLSTFML